jgi:hypothetical protein
MNEILPLNEPPAELTEDGRIIETSIPEPARSPAQEVPGPYEYDVFVSHAHEDKDTIARPLAQSLVERGYRVFLDENELVAGDSLRDRLAHALGHSRVGVVILSPAFFAKNWTRYEFRALLDRDSTDPTSLIIPIWHGVDADQVRIISPQLADRLALSADAGLPTVVRGIERALQRLAGNEARVPAAGTDGDQDQPAAALPATVQRRRPHIPWLGKHERLTVGDYILIAVIAGIIVAAVLALIHLLGTSSHPRSATHGPVPRSSTASSSTGSTASTPGSPAPGSTAVIEYADNRHGAPVFADPRGDPVAGVPNRIPYGTRVVVSCVAPNETGAMNTVHGFYLIASGRWRGDYVVADTMSNGGQLGATNTPNIDPRVRRCAS